ncbi:MULTISPECIES: DsbA family protein [Paenibacillus]|jgi:protein-disulfide isomerase|uniref:Disulfide bond formation protein DsbB n=1 Tax=Paenibacillus odorifer TaxID=189426 RepID=A0A1R0WRQ2_9BACL|nr:MULTISPECIES: DsbA family protein [Paenibacillus]AIQ74766.1 disulfide bond formation protein DsbB [Paenibacillus odorifer]ETT46492.1 putative disulfide bond formation protein D [Paenibacillus sp. FSL H8-237]MDH6428497.1 protein-disulfide isomerase [Paenibacillus sp. PastH-4]MDH6443868.1 protein-disulfide isomerase [Paenibacillus sp. PastF-4]MDH6527773.1 protein-disulfide isomerase [Paenibacillus sp. PastH-3]
MNKKVSAKQSQTKRPLLPMILGVVVVILLAVIVFILSNKTDDTADLPNYTDVKGSIVVDGLKYEKQPHLGSPDAKVKVIEFADFKCPACKMWTEKYLDTFIKDYVDTGKVELFFMNFAFLDRDSYLAASAGEAIYKQSNEKFWEYLHKLYANQGDESEIWATQKFILKFVKNNIEGIDYAQFETDLKNHTYMFDVKEDFKIAGSYGVNGTPKFMVNGVLLQDSSYEGLAAAIDKQ